MGGERLTDLSASYLAPSLQWEHCIFPGAGVGISSNGNNARPWPWADASSSDTHGMDPRCRLQNFLQWKVEPAFIIHLTRNARSEEQHMFIGTEKKIVHGVPGFQCLFPSC